MPIFEFVCEECGKQFERIFFISECDTAVTCPSCGSERTKKSFSVFSHTGIEKGLSSSCGSSGGARGHS
ncbi:MAG: FmdB family zinc ribbon protein [Desulfomonilaceae bacterium]